MIRLILYFIILAAVAYAGMLLVEHPGHIDLDWFGYQIQTSAALLMIAVAIVAIVVWTIFRIVVGLPSVVRFAARQRRREKGYAALSRGLVAVGAGDARGASRASSQASQHLKGDTLALMLQAQAAQLAGNRQGALRAYEGLAQREDTRILGLRGLYADASHRGDDEAARHFAEAAHKAAPLPWSAHAVLEHRASAADWERALSTVESSVKAGLVDKETGERQRAVLETAIAYDTEGTAPEQALTLVRAAMKRAPDLAPPVVLAARLLSRRGDIRKAAKLVEKAWPRCQHPDIAQAYLDVRPGDSTTDRLDRAKTLMGVSSFDPVSRMTVGRAALACREYATARAAMEPLVGEGRRPTARMCLLMAEIDEAEHGDIGLWREWLARASRAALDPAWVADGIVYDRWSPASPTTGKLDAFRWQVPAERLGPAMEAMPAPRPRAPEISAAPSPAAISHEPEEAPATIPDIIPAPDRASESSAAASAAEATPEAPRAFMRRAKLSPAKLSPARSSPVAEPAAFDTATAARAILPLDDASETALVTASSPTPGETPRPAGNGAAIASDGILDSTLETASDGDATERFGARKKGSRRSPSIYRS